jgi:hypothetical protein
MKQPQKPWPSIEVDRWCWQVQVLDDLAEFVQAHGPFSALPLPTVNWTLGVGRKTSADLLDGDHASMDTLAVFARALDTRVQQRRLIKSAIYYVRGRIGAREGRDREPQTSILLRMTVLLDIDGVGEVS